MNIMKSFLHVFSRITRTCAAACAAFIFVSATAQVNTDQMVNVGRNAMFFDDYVLSIQHFNRAIQAKPYQARPYLYRAIAKFNLEDFKGAEADASRAIELNPFITDAWEVRGVARQNQGNDAGAVEDYRHALSLLPHNRQISFNLANAQLNLGELQQADSTFSEILKAYPGFENGYLGRARLRLEQKDTIAAKVDIDKALSINRNSFNAHAMLADLAMRSSSQNLDSALIHINEAIRLQPRFAGLYVNRAFIKYTNDDWFGAMSDYDYALSLEPLNRMALFNRGILEMQANANDRALEDFNKVLSLDPDDVRARYNRAVILGNKHQYADAIADVDHVIEEFPDFPTGYYMRSEYRRLSGNTRGAMADYDRARALSKRLRPVNGKVDEPASNSQSKQPNSSNSSSDAASEAEAALARREFASLLTVNDNTDFREEYNNSWIRGRVQDRNVSIDIDPFMELTFYTSPSQLRQNSYYIKEVDNLNSTRALRMSIMVSNHIPQLDDESLIDRHFKSIEYYNSYISTHSPRSIDFIGRAMDFLTVHNYQAAVADLNRAIALTPDFSPAFMLRAQARWRNLESGLQNEDADQPKGNLGVLRRAAEDEILADIDKVIQLSPDNAFAWFNRGNLMVQRGDLQAARKAFNKAIEVKPDFAEAFFNRGYVNLTDGQRAAGISDLSRAGELGIVTAYNLMKRMAH